MTIEDYPDRLEMRALDAKLVKLTTKAVRDGTLTNAQALRILRVYRFSMLVIDFARDKLNF